MEPSKEDLEICLGSEQTASVQVMLTNLDNERAGRRQGDRAEEARAAAALKAQQEAEAVLKAEEEKKAAAGVQIGDKAFTAAGKEKNFGGSTGGGISVDPADNASAGGTSGYGGTDIDLGVYEEMGRGVQRSLKRWVCQDLLYDRHRVFLVRILVHHTEVCVRVVYIVHS